MLRKCSFIIYYLSIHDLTKRSTASFFSTYHTGVLSIHDLTKRSTLHTLPNGQKMAPFNSRPHEEVDCHAESFISGRFGFQFTTSRRGRQSYPYPRIYPMHFQFTTSRRGRRLFLILRCRQKSFQFTTSRRGRRCYFSSLVDNIHLSIHDLTKRSTSEMDGYIC